MNDDGGIAAFFDFSVLGIACSGGLNSQHGWLLGKGGELLVLDGDVTVLIPPRGFRR